MPVPTPSPPGVGCLYMCTSLGGGGRGGSQVYGERYNTGLRQREIDVGTQVSSGIGEREQDFEGNREDVTQENKFVEEAREGVGGGAAGRGGRAGG